MELIVYDQVEIMSWHSFLPRNISKKTSQQEDLDCSSISLTSQSFFYDPCQSTASNLAFYINPQRRPDIV